MKDLGLPRNDRVLLSRLKCGHHKALPPYQHRLGNVPSDLCLRCLSAPATAEHVMASCPAIACGRLNHVITITLVRDLWKRQRDSINYLKGVGPNIGPSTGHNIYNLTCRWVSTLPNCALAVVLPSLEVLYL